MSPRSSSLADYLRARRAAIKPEDVGFPADSRRRVSGLKRAEVAELAGISLEYYTRLEQGRAYQVSEQVLARITEALQLSGDDAAYFYKLALPGPPVRLVPRARKVSDAVRRLVDEWSDFPLYVFDRNQDVLISNDIGAELFPRMTEGHNCVESMFEVPLSIRQLDGWKDLVTAGVAALRYQGDPADPRFNEIVDNLLAKHDEFRALWESHAARPFTSGSVPVHVDGVGSGDFPWQVLNIPDGLFMVVWVAPPGSFAAQVTDYLRTMLREAPRTAS